MRIAVTAAVLLAVVATAVVAVCQHSETRHLQYRVWQLERRGERLERDRRRLRGAIGALRTPRRLLREHDFDAPPRDAAAELGTRPARSHPGPATSALDAPVGFDPGDNFEGAGR